MVYLRIEMTCVYSLLFIKDAVETLFHIFMALALIKFRLKLLYLLNHSKVFLLLLDLLSKLFIYSVITHVFLEAFSLINHWAISGRCF